MYNGDHVNKDKETIYTEYMNYYIIMNGENKNKKKSKKSRITWK